MSLLFDRCNDRKKQEIIQNLIEISKSKEASTNDDYNRGLGAYEQTNYLNYESSSNGNNYELDYKPPLLRFRRLFIDECCLRQCTQEELENYCPKE